VLAMTYSDEGKQDTLKYRSVGSQEPIGSWGHEYVKFVSRFPSSFTGVHDVFISWPRENFSEFY
jgi:hypothetical protein